MMRLLLLTLFIDVQRIVREKMSEHGFTVPDVLAQAPITDHIGKALHGSAQAQAKKKKSTTMGPPISSSTSTARAPPPKTSDGKELRGGRVRGHAGAKIASSKVSQVSTLLRNDLKMT